MHCRQPVKEIQAEEIPFAEEMMPILREEMTVEVVRFSLLLKLIEDETGIGLRIRRSHRNAGFARLGRDTADDGERLD